MDRRRKRAFEVRGSVAAGVSEPGGQRSTPFGQGPSLNPLHREQPQAELAGEIRETWRGLCTLSLAVAHHVRWSHRVILINLPSSQLLLMRTRLRVAGQCRDEVSRRQVSAWEACWDMGRATRGCLPLDGIAIADGLTGTQEWVHTLI